MNMIKVLQSCLLCCLQFVIKNHSNKLPLLYCILIATLCLREIERVTSQTKMRPRDIVTEPQIILRLFKILVVVVKIEKIKKIWYVGFKLKTPSLK